MGVRRIAVANGPNIFQMLLVELKLRVRKRWTKRKVSVDRLKINDLKMSSLKLKSAWI